MRGALYFTWQMFTYTVMTVQNQKCSVTQSSVAGTVSGFQNLMENKNKKAKGCLGTAENCCVVKMETSGLT